MNRHQVLTGACNYGDQCFAVGSVEGVHFTAYATGCDIVILANDFQRVQIIPGVTHGNIKVSCIDCSTDTGKVAASYHTKVYIFEPTPLIHHDSSHKLDYKWFRTAVITTDSFVNCLSWNLDGSKLLTGGDQIQLWEHSLTTVQPEAQGPIRFHVGETVPEDEVLESHSAPVSPPPSDEDKGNVMGGWGVAWSCRPATPVFHLKFSPDGLLFASAGQADRLVKIWYENRKLQLTESVIRQESFLSPRTNEYNFSFVYISHPRAVTGFDWRQTSKYMPRGALANMLVTSCKDNICRIWSETILPDDGLVNLEQLDPSFVHDPKFHTHRHKKRFMHRLRHIRHSIHKRKKQTRVGPPNVMSLPSITSSASIHDFHKFGFHQSGLAPSFHFHLAASINPETDIPLLPTVGGRGHIVETDFRLHWLNNKELQFSMEAETILQELHRKSILEEGPEVEGQAGEEVESPMDDTHSDDLVNFGDGADGKSEQDEHTESEPEPVTKRKRPKLFKRSSRSQSSRSSDSRASEMNRSLSNPEFSTDEQDPDIGATAAAEGVGVDELDRKIEGLLRDWHQCPDMLYSIHPVDGSFLVWLVDWLDEFTPFCFRQAQVSFSSRIPHAFPVPDSRSMAANLMMYCNYSKMDIKSAMKMSESRSILDYNKLNAIPTMSKYSLHNTNMLIPHVSIVSKHVNGTLNQWQISFAENSKFATVLSVAHVARACGHRFRTNTAACHPVLPLLLTTSHHNIPEYDDGTETPVEKAKGRESDLIGGFNFCSELILWRVDPVGPLSKSGGIVELARINSPNISAFSNVAWIPTLLPSTTLGSYSNSPSALFVASDGVSLRMYQAVIDARTLLMEIGPHNKDLPHMLSMSSSYSSSGYSDTPPTPVAPSDIFRIISLQSTSRPGCIMELDALSEACQDWQQTQLLHVFQEQLIVGRHSNKTNHTQPPSLEPMVDLHNMASFDEQFYLVVLEGLTEGGSMLHMWKIIISSQPTHTDAKDPMAGYVPDATLIQEDYDSSPSSRSNTPDLPQPELGHTRQVSCVKLCLTTTKVSSQKLPLYPGVSVVYATVAAGHLSSSSIYPACYAPYLLSTACSDGKVRFWRCDVLGREVSQVNMEVGPDDLSVMSSSYNYEMTISDVSGERPSLTHFTQSLVLDKTYEWKEWDMVIPREESSTIRVQGRPICVSCAYSGRVAVAYRYGNIRAMADNPDNKFVNLCVAIYECESTGGSEWTLEDTIELKNISIPDPGAEIDLSMITPTEPERPPPTDNRLSFTPKVSRTKSIPSLSTIQSVRRSINEQGNKTGALVQKHLVQLDWVSTEDGSHVLTVGVGSKIIMYSQVSNEIAQVCHREGRSTAVDGGGASRPPQARGRPMLQKSKTMVVEDTPEEIRWMKLRTIDLGTADGLPSLPMHMSWVRSGILVVGMDNEMHVYSQWKSPDVLLEAMSSESSTGLQDRRNLTDHSLSSLVNGPVPSAPLNSFKQPTTFKTSQSMPGLKYAAMMSVGGKKKDLSSRKGTLAKSESTTSLSLISESGLFEAAHRANPVLPQYHPKQLMELLNFGKVKRVKAILAHLVRCIAGNDAYQTTYHDELDSQESRSRALHRQRTMSVSGTTAPELAGDFEPALDYVEISSIPPLPIHALLAADSDTAYKAELSPSGRQKSTQQDYSDLFATNFQDDDMDDPFSDDSSVYDPSTPVRGRQLSGSGGWDMNYFGPAQGRLLAKHLTYTHLPGLSSLDQMYLLALGDTVANTKTDFNDRFAMETAKAHVLTEQSTQTAESMDDCGLRFMLAMRHHIYLVRTLPPRQRVMLRQQGLKMFNIVWAFHSEATEELLALIPSMQKGAPTWEELRQFGAGWWVYNINILKTTIEKVAKAAFQANSDPLDAAVFYLALKKKNVLWGLFRSVSDKRMSDFFRNNFQEDRWRKAALKNAFALLGRQRFMHAAAFFLLAGALHDAVEVCTEKLKDVQLALVICRLHDNDDPLPNSVKTILYEKVLGCDSNGQNYNPCRAHPDPFLRSMGLWLLKDYTSALNTLLQTGIGQSHLVEDEDIDTVSTSPNVFNFYNYLRTHPLLVRQRLATMAQERKKVLVILSGFSHADANQQADKGVNHIDKITPLERRLFFQTAHMHFKAGCPALALEVLSKLPSVVVSEEDEDGEVDDKSFVETKGERCIETGTINEYDDKPIVNGFHKANDFDWSQSSSALDWSQPVSATNMDSASAIDWSQPLTSRFDGKLDLDLDLDLGSDKDASEEDNSSDITRDTSVIVHPSRSVCPQREDSMASGSVGAEDLTEDEARAGDFDIMAQQYKFIACLKILMEELTTLATGFEVDGGQLRYQLYIWLEREVEALKLLCNYRQELTDEEETKAEVADKALDDSLDMHVSGHMQRSLSIRETTHKPTLHEVIMAETMNFEAKLERMSRRRQWLHNNQQLLRTLISYCILQGSGGGGLASIRMELILLLQELQQVKPQQQLLSPLPFPTTLPLLSASIASSKTVIADPIKHLQGMIQDLLHTIVEFTVPPCHHYMSEAVLLLRNLSVALSSCIYQCLCDSDSFVVSMADLDVAMEGFTSHSVIYQGGHLMAGVRHKRRTSSTEEIINTPPGKWPGVGSLRVLLAREKDDDAPKLTVLLSEALVGVYISLLINAMAAYDAHMLYRLISHKFTVQMWAALFGGGVKTLLKVANTPSHQKPSDDLAKQRMKLNMKIMGNVPVSTQKHESKRTFKEKFVPPELSMVTYFMTKPFQSSTDMGVEYDSEETLSSEDNDSDLGDADDRYRPRTMSVEAVQEHIDPSSYSWCLIRFAIIQLVLHNLNTFLPLVGIELQDLPVCSPLLHAVLKTLEQWQEMLKSKLDMFNGPPDNYIPDMYLEGYGNQPFAKYRALLEPHNTPFVNQHASLPVRRLWHQLIRQESLQDIFIRYIFKKKRAPEDSLDAVRDGDSDTSEPPKEQDPVKIIHKEQDIISAFTINQANPNCISLSTQKELVELDISSILDPPAWLDDDTEYDIELMRKQSIGDETSDFLVIQVPQDRKQSLTPQSQFGSQMSISSVPQSGLQYSQSGRGASVIIRRPVIGVRRIASHPHLPHYLTGSADGSVRMWEWGHGQSLTTLRQPGSFPKVTKVLYNTQGNKCCVSDAEGSVCLWQVGPGSNFNKPIMSLPCHNKTTSDFAFVGSSSMLVTAGHSSESKNVCLWDTLLPPRSCLVHAFTCHEHGSPALLYAPQHQVVISGGRKGEICIFDIRQRQMRHTFQAHEGPIKCLALDPEEEYFITGSAEGDIKVWGLDIHQLIHSFVGEHSKNTFFRNMGSAAGVTQIAVGPNHHLFSCGVDGSMKFRQIPEKDIVVHQWGA
ncbi:dmX-like protein 2 isoform X2 [Liolophura sinensis]|uniref:dmX-like protein 2 isoform X2 n=1 Tax=Liolophura sinensis TaxID=3198878 RepID=UPI003158FFB8